MHSFDLRDDFGISIWVHHVHTGRSPTILICMDSTVGALCHARGWWYRVRHTLPKFCSAAIQTESTVQGRVGIIHALGRIFLDRFGESVQ